MPNGNDRTEAAHTAMMTRQARADDRLRGRLKRAVDDFEGAEEDRTSVTINMPPAPPSFERQNSIGSPPMPVAKVLKWFPPHWRPWLLLAFLVVSVAATLAGFPGVRALLGF